MAKRTTCMYGDTLIGIESIYTVTEDGRQINIPDKITWLRSLSRKNLLKCPCGECDGTLVLVAGDRNLKAQHFRMKNGTGKGNCSATQETDKTVAAKIALKCWLDDKLGHQYPQGNIESRVPITRFTNTKRRYEVTFYHEASGTGLCYWNSREDVEQEKIDEIELSGLKHRLYITCVWNSGTKGQYPLYMMQIQKAQRFCLYLTTDPGATDIYASAVMDVRVYLKDRHGAWTERCILTGPLKQYELKYGVLTYNNVPITTRVKEDIRTFRAQEFPETKTKNDKIHFCPKCGAKLVVRKGKNGAFWGCNRYPTCLYTTRFIKG